MVSFPRAFVSSLMTGRIHHLSASQKCASYALELSLVAVFGRFLSVEIFNSARQVGEGRAGKIEVILHHVEENFSVDVEELGACFGPDRCGSREGE